MAARKPKAKPGRWPRKSLKVIKETIAAVAAEHERAAPVQPLKPLDVFGSAIGALIKINGGRWSVPRNLIPNTNGTIHYELTQTDLIFTMRE